MAVIAYVFNQLVGLYVVVIIVSVVMSWLVAFNVINRHNRFVDAVLRTCFALTEPLLRPIRNFLPNMGGIDISPIILLIGVNAFQYAVNLYIFKPLLRSIP
ncbi:MAG: YggT family protein [Parvularculaceae bacterium]